MQLILLRSYPGGNFERNQQLNDSISISPLYQISTSNLHVSTVMDLHPDFSGLHPNLVKLIIFRVLTIWILLRGFKKIFLPPDLPRILPPFGPVYFHYEPMVWHQCSFQTVRLLDPCYKTGWRKGDVPAAVGFSRWKHGRNE